MGIGFGIVLIAAGAILMWALTDVSIPYVDADTLGLILFVVGLFTVALAVFMNFQSSRSKHVQEHQYRDHRGNGYY